MGGASLLQETTTSSAMEVKCQLLFVATSLLFTAGWCAEECFVGIGMDYRGTKTTTVSGRTCQAWSSQSPHKHDRTPQRYPGSDLIGNKCRNPDKEAEPWCYTTDSGKRWEYCGVPHCKDCFEGKGAGYRGQKTTTKSGKTCQAWSSQSPHKHDRTPKNYPGGDLRGNFCRNPDNEAEPWCYTTDSGTRWEFCGVAKCKGTKNIIKQEITNLEYKMDQKRIIKNPPGTIGAARSRNYACRVVTKSVTITRGITRSNSWEFGSEVTNEINAAVTVEVSGGIPGIAVFSASATVGASHSKTLSSNRGKSVETTTQYSVTQSMTIPSNHICSIRMEARKAKVDIPYTALLVITYKNGEVTKKPVHGIFRAVAMTDIEGVIERCKPIPNAVPCPTKN